MAQATSGTTVALHYTGTLSDGSVFDSSEGRDPLSFTLGEGQIIPGLEAAVEGMTEGEEKTVTVACDQAYGERDPNAMQQIPRDQIPANIPTDPAHNCRCRPRTGRQSPS